MHGLLRHSHIAQVDLVVVDRPLHFIFHIPYLRGRIELHQVWGRDERTKASDAHFGDSWADWPFQILFRSVVFVQLTFGARQSRHANNVQRDGYHRVVN